eukprot:403345439
MVDKLDLSDLGVSLNNSVFGPSAGTQWDNFDGKFYQPYNKKEKIGKVCDFVSVATQQAMAQANLSTAAHTKLTQKTQAAAAAQAAPQKELFDEDDKGFEVVEQETVVKKKKTYTQGERGGRGGYQQRGGYQNWHQRGAQRGGRGGNQRGGRGGYYRGQQDYGGFVHNFGKRGFREASIEIRGDWPVIEELSKNQLEKLNPVQATLSSVAAQCGEIHAYNRDLDKARTYKPQSLQVFNGQVFNVQTLDDPVIKRLAQENKAQIFATETAVAAIMTAPKSLYSWDVVIKKYLDKIFIDKRDEHNMLDNLTVNETSSENQPMDDETLNGVRQLMAEAVNVNNSWRYQQYAKNQKIDLAEKDPFVEVEGQVAARLGYLYKIWDLGNKRKICIRSTVHAYLPKQEQEPVDEESKEEAKQVKQIYQNTYAVVEYENNKSNWKQNLDLMMGQCMTREVQDNSAKVTRWVIESLLAGAEQIKFAFLTRKTAKSNQGHILLGTYGVSTNSFANQINLNMSNCWAILRDLIDGIYIDGKKTGEQSGEYIYMKDPNKALMRLFRITAEDEDEEDQDDEL